MFHLLYVGLKLFGTVSSLTIEEASQQSEALRESLIAVFKNCIVGNERIGAISPLFCFLGFILNLP